MPKIIELTVEINVQKVSCPGVWLCQDGRVSLSIFTLGTSYQTCMLPPVFPLMYKDVFYFRKRFQETCALNNICCLLKDENIYCELVQWCEDCIRNDCQILAQYLGSLNDLLFPPNMCSNDGVDLLMRRTSEFPGILSPKIEICTKVRIDEVWDQNLSYPSPLKIKSCSCSKDTDVYRQKQVCHSADYHRSKCNTSRKQPPSIIRSRSKVRSAEKSSCCSLIKETKEPNCYCPEPLRQSPNRRQNNRSPVRERPCPRQYNVYNVEVPDVNRIWSVAANTSEEYSDGNDGNRPGKEIKLNTAISEPLHRTLIESRFIQEPSQNVRSTTRTLKPTAPCVCEICKRYHELFHM